MPIEETSKLRQFIAGLGLMILTLMLTVAYVTACFGVFWLLSAAVYLVADKEITDSTPVRLLALLAGFVAAYRLKDWLDQNTRLTALKADIIRYGGWESNCQDT